MATVKTEIPLKEHWDPQELDSLEDTQYFNLDGSDLKTFYVVREAASVIIRAFLERPDETPLVVEAINEHLENTLHGESPRRARIVKLGNRILVDTVDKKRSEDEPGTEIGKDMIKILLGEKCIQEVEEDGDMHLERLVITPDLPLKESSHPIPIWTKDRIARAS